MYRHFLLHISAPGFNCEVVRRNQFGATMPVDLDAVIEQVASEPFSVSVDGETVQNHKLTDLIAARDAVEQSDGIEKPHRGIYITKLRAPGSA